MKTLSSLLVALLLCNGVSFAGQLSPSAATPKEALNAEKAKNEVQKRGIGEKSRVTVKLPNETEVKGYVSEAGDASFAVLNKKTGQATTIAYADVYKVQGPGLSKGAKIAIVTGVVVVVIVVAAAASVAAQFGKV